MTKYDVNGIGLRNRQINLFHFQNGKLQKVLAESQEHIQTLELQLNGMNTAMKELKSQLNASKERVHDYVVCGGTMCGHTHKCKFTISILQVLRRTLGEMQKENDKLTNDLSDKCGQLNRSNEGFDKLQKMYDSLHGDYK